MHNTTISRLFNCHTKGLLQCFISLLIMFYNGKIPQKMFKGAIGKPQKKNVWSDYRKRN